MNTLMRPSGIALILFLGVVFSLGLGRNDLSPHDRALALHREAPVIDGHNDLPWRLRETEDLLIEKHDLLKAQPDFHTDIPRLRKGGVGAQFWSAYVPVETVDTGTAVKMTFEQIQVIRTMIAKYPDVFELAGTASDVERIRASGKIASMIGIEGGHSIDSSLDTLRKMHALGARYMTLTHWKNTPWADAATDKEEHGGLTAFGEEVVRELNRLGMFVDISHVSAKTMRHALRITKAPVIASHSSAYAIKAHVRNVPDDVLLLVKANEGVVMVNFYTGFIAREDWTKPFFGVAGGHTHFCEEHRADLELWAQNGWAPRADVGTVANHVEHIIKIAGIDHVGVGGDYDGVPTLPDGLEDVSKYPALTEELIRRGHSEAELRKILGGNVLRAFAKIEEVSRQ